MKIRIIFFLIILFSAVSLHFSDELKAAESSDIIENNPDYQTLVIFSSETKKVDEHQRTLDLSLGHFSENNTYKSAQDVKPADLKDKTHLVYYGETKDKLPASTIDLISSFKGPTLVIGYNVEQLNKKYAFLDLKGEETVTEIENFTGKKIKHKIEPNTILNTEIKDKVDVLAQTHGKNGDFPIIMKEHNNYYVAIDTVTYPFSACFSQSLYEFFDVDFLNKTPAYIRLEDIHPLVDAKKLKIIAEELKDREIPYMIAVIPVYTDPKTKKEYHFEDRPEILSTLKYMQNNGGSVILHGYTHQFRHGETGEGFEFWDVENQMPIYHGPEDKVEPLLHENDFKTKKEFQTYDKNNKHFETNYIKERLTRGVQELTNYGLYPLAFEAPHYTMSQHGYEVTAKYFSTYVGQIQLSDEDWEIMDTTPYVTKPSFLNGLTVLPETIGYVNPDDKGSIDTMMEKADYFQTAEGAMIGGFYHPYLGSEDFITLIDEMESINNIEWVDLKNIDNTVKVEHVTIASHNGEIQTDINRKKLMLSSYDYPLYHVKKFLTDTTWGIAVIGILGVLLFVSFIIYQIIKQLRLAHLKKVGK